MGNFSSPRCRITHLGSRFIWLFHLFCRQKLVKGMKRLILFSMVCLVAIASTAQSISGRVTDEQAQPMPFANVVLVNRSDSAYIAGAVTKDDGTFSINTDKQDGLLKVSSIGYIIRYIDARQGNVGDILMQPDTQTLGEVVVKGERPQYKMTTGGMTVDIDRKSVV